MSTVDSASRVGEMASGGKEWRDHSTLSGESSADLGPCEPNTPDPPFKPESNEKIIPIGQVRKSLLSRWWFDLVCLVGGLSSMITLVVLLGKLHGTRLQHWVFGITLNGIISVLSFIWKACTGVCFANCIGQLKWQWFQTNRRLADIQTFDDASRGGIAGIRLLFRTRWAVARLAGLVVVLSVAFDPFLQQLVSYPTSTTEIPSQNVTISRGVTYTMEGDGGSRHQDRIMGWEDKYFAAQIQASLILTSPGWTTDYQSIRSIGCPRSSNCTWDAFPTIGLCYECAEITSANWETDCDQGLGNCSYSIPGVARFDIERRKGYSSFIFESREVSANVSEQWLNISNPILTLASLKLPYTSELYTETYPPRNATVCTFYPCVYKAMGTVISGKSRFDMVSSWRNESARNPSEAQGQDTLQDAIMKPTRQDLGFNDTEPFDQSTYFIPSPVVELVRTTLRATLVLQVFFIENSAKISTTFTHEGLGNTALGGQAFALGGGQWESSFEAVAKAAAYYMAALTENDKHLLHGYIVDRFTAIDVRWWWLTLPVTVFVATIILMGITMAKSRDMPAWKNSILPLVFHSHPSEEAELRDTGDESELKRMAGSMAMSIKGEGVGMKLTFSGGTQLTEKEVV